MGLAYHAVTTKYGIRNGIWNGIYGMMSIAHTVKKRVYAVHLLGCNSSTLNNSPLGCNSEPKMGV